MTPEDHVLDHYENPRHRSWGDRDVTLPWDNASSGPCGDTIVFWAWIKDGVIVDLWWQGEGCCFSQAAASMLAERAVGSTVAEMKAFPDYDMFELFQADFPIAREGCILVGLKALQRLLETL